MMPGEDYKVGELILYRNGDTFEIGEIKRLCDDGAFVYYSTGDTAAKTRYEDMHKIVNGYAFKRVDGWKR